LLFWTHLATGTVAGVVIAVMCVTGAALAMKPQILAAIDAKVRTVDPRGRTPLEPSALAAAAHAALGAAPASIVIDRNPAASVAASASGRTLYIDPYTGAALGEASPRAQRVFRWLEDWHRWLAFTGPDRTAARAVTGACNAAFLLLALSGLYLWWPRAWTLQHTRPILALRRTATPRARDFNLHNVFGFWMLPVIVVMTATGIVMSYPWANDLLYRAMGSTPPARAARGGGRADTAPRGAGGPSSDVSAAGLDAAWRSAREKVPAWSVLTFRLPQERGALVSVSIVDGESWNAFARSQLTVDRSGAVRQWQPYATASLGQKARGWVRFGHTGELGGVIGQVLAGAGCVGGVALVWTGFSLAFRRACQCQRQRRRLAAFRRTRDVAALGPERAAER
jgi:uncharacterized iron-regulated membrane protein